MTFLLRRKGTSVAEMIIAIAVLAIVSTIVVSFIVVANEKVGTSNDKVKALNDIEAIESMVDGWVSKKLNEGCEFSASINNANKYMLLKSENNVTNDKENLYFWNGQLFIDDNPVYKSSVITKIEYLVVDETKQDNGYLIVCQITYDIRKTSKKTLTYEYAFSVSDYKHIIAENTEQGD